MKRFFGALLVIIMLVAMTGVAEAGVWETIKGFTGGTAIALILSGVLAFGVVSYYAGIASNLLIATGALLSSMGLSLADRRLTKEEIADAKEKWRAVVKTVKEIKNAKR